MTDHDDTDPGRGGRRGRGARFALATTLVAATLAACSTAGSVPSPSPSGSPAGLAGRTFLSTSLTDSGAPFTLVPGTQIRLTFQERELGASAGCNAIGGQYRIEGGQLIFDGASMTEMACPDGRDAQDQWLIGILSGRPTITLSGNDLMLVAGTVTIKLVDREIAEPDQPLAGPVWTITGVISGEAVSSIPGDVSTWLQFNRDGGLILQTGCNGGGGRWTMKDGTLELSDLVMELRLCGGAAGQVETAILAVLHAGPLGVAITSNSMTLTAGAAGLMLQAPGLD